jgi:prepilin-type processing-associated H-X9-DG protein
LTEVVISIGVAVLLAALVMPAVSTVKRRAALSTCAAHLGDIGRSLFALQAERGGYGCLAGAITISNAAGRSLPDALDDSARRRYSYLSLPLQPWGPGFVDRLLPLPLVLSPRRTGAATSLAEVLQQAGDAANPGLRRFRCPGVLDGAARDLPTEVITVDGVAHYMGYGVKVDYGINSTVFGFTTNPAVVQARGRGRIPKNGSSRIVLLADRDVDDPGAGVATWATRTSNPATLRDVIQDPGSFAFACKVDVRRHRSRTNVLFCDGHVETVREDNLRNCFIVSP